MPYWQAHANQVHSIRLYDFLYYFQILREIGFNQYLSKKDMVVFYFVCQPYVVSLKFATQIQAKQNLKKEMKISFEKKPLTFHYTNSKFHLKVTLTMYSAHCWSEFYIFFQKIRMCMKIICCLKTDMKQMKHISWNRQIYLQNK